jgi:hypothetical protein
MYIRGLCAMSHYSWTKDALVRIIHHRDTEFTEKSRKKMKLIAVL